MKNEFTFKSINILIIFYLISLLFIGCGENKKKIKEDTLLCNISNTDSIKNDSLQKESLQNKIKNINFYFENSGSMKGYLKSSNFKDVVSNLIVKLNGKGSKDSLKLFTIASDIFLFEKQPDIFIEELANGNIGLQGFSSMHEIFKVILGDSKPNDINFFVSDCILSYSNDDINKNSEINKESVSELKNQLLNVVQDHVNKNDLSFALFAFKSDFNGTYYDYHNTHIINEFNKRPYYIWVTGKKNHLNKLIPWIESLQTFNNHLEEKILFNLNDFLANDYRIIKKRVKPGYKLSKDKKSIKHIEANTITFYVAMNLECLPEKIKDKDYLKDNLKIKALKHSDKSEVSISNVYNYNELMEIENIKNPNQKKICEQATHFIQVEINQVISEETLRITLPEYLPTWYKKWSTMNDTNINENFDKTFGFEWFVNGVKEAYTNKNNNNLDILIDIN